LLQDPIPNHITKHFGVGVAQNVLNSRKSIIQTHWTKGCSDNWFGYVKQYCLHTKQKHSKVSMNIIRLVVQIGQVTFYCESVHQPKKFDLFRQTIFPHERMGSGLETNPPTVTDDKFASPSPN